MFRSPILRTVHYPYLYSCSLAVSVIVFYSSIANRCDIEICNKSKSDHNTWFPTDGHRSYCCNTDFIFEIVQSIFAYVVTQTFTETFSVMLPIISAGIMPGRSTSHLHAFLAPSSRECEIPPTLPAWCISVAFLHKNLRANVHSYN